MEAVVARLDRPARPARAPRRTGRPQLGAINVAGPRARDLLATLSDDDLGRDAIPYPGHAEITVAGVPCRAVAVGFVGRALLRAPPSPQPKRRAVGRVARGRVEPGTSGPTAWTRSTCCVSRRGTSTWRRTRCPTTIRAKLGLGWAVSMDKDDFVGKRALERMDALPLERKLVGLRFDGAPLRGAPLMVDDQVVGRVTSCATSVAVGAPIGLGWLRTVDGVFPETLRSGRATATVVPTPFYDPEGVRLRA